MDFVRDNPGEPVPEETVTQSRTVIMSARNVAKAVGATSSGGFLVALSVDAVVLDGVVSFGGLMS